MSLHVEFEPHSWYKGFAIRHYLTPEPMPNAFDWYAYIDNGNTYRVDELQARTLKELKQKITEYHQRINARDAYNRARLGE